MEVTRPTGWYQTTAETSLPGGVVGSIWRWYDAERRVWTHHVANGPGPVPEEYRPKLEAQQAATTAMTLPKTAALRIRTP